jgi:MFS family permease
MTSQPESARGGSLAPIVLATFLTLVPVTLLVPGLAELVMVAHGGSRAAAHAFMAINMLTGIVAVPVVMVLVRRFPRLVVWIAGLLLADAALFVAMGAATSLAQLLALRALDGAVHLPAVTLLMVAANRAAGRRRGATLGAVAGAIMFGVAVGAPLGGWLVSRGPAAVYGAGAPLLVLAALLVVASRAVFAHAAPASGGTSRYRWDHRAAHAWMPLCLGFMDRFTIGVFSSTFTLYLGEVAGASPAWRGVLIALFMIPFAVLCWPAGRVADRIGWFAPLVAGNLGFGVVYAAYGLTPPAALPVVMVLSGVLSALMYAPNLVLVGEMARRGAGEGLFGAFQIAGSLGFLAGPMVGGALVELTRAWTGEVEWTAIFAGVGALVVTFGVAAAVVLRPLAREWRGELEEAAA